MQIFKECGNCGTTWQTAEAFFSPEELTPLGFQAHFFDGSKSLLLFHHHTNECQTTLAIRIKDVAHLIPGYSETESVFLSEKCPELCLTDSHLEGCGHPNCRNSLVCDFVQELLEKKKRQQEFVLSRDLLPKSIWIN